MLYENGKYKNDILYYTKVIDQALNKQDIEEACSQWKQGAYYIPMAPETVGYHSCNGLRIINGAVAADDPNTAMDVVNQYIKYRTDYYGDPDVPPLDPDDEEKIFFNGCNQMVYGYLMQEKNEEALDLINRQIFILSGMKRLKISFLSRAKDVLHKNEDPEYRLIVAKTFRNNFSAEALETIIPKEKQILLNLTDAYRPFDEIEDGFYHKIKTHYGYISFG
jgi:hypothetical protein